jgi:TatA/E family protein of Tat protein translocase
LGTWELLIILAVVLLIFGPSRLPKMARGVGEMVREFRNEFRVMKGEIDGTAEAESASRSTSESDTTAEPGGRERSA